MLPQRASTPEARVPAENSRHVGGIGPESTIEYYRFIIEGYRERQSGTGILPVDIHAQDARATSYPSIIINSVDLNRLIGWINAGELEPFTDYLAAAVEQLARAGADFAVLAANTPHIVFDQIRERSRLPLISIAEATRQSARVRIAATWTTRHALYDGGEVLS